VIEIVTLFLGLVTGPQPVELAVGPQATAVEIRLDGQVVERLTSPPWDLEIDLGEALVPHELVAIARDETGRELARARRWINIDMPMAKIDGRAPPGGLTALPLVLGADRIPAPAEMSAWFQADGHALVVSAVHQGPAEVLVVQDPVTRPALENMARIFLGYQLDRLGIPARQTRSDSPDWNPELLRTPQEAFRDAAMELFDVPGNAPESLQIGRLWRAYHEFAGLGDETAVRFISPLAAPVSRSASQRYLFAGSAGVADVGLFWLIEKVPPMGFARRVADAVAIAGREAHAGGRRRGVVLLLDDEATDNSLHTVSAVRSYLRALRVPLFIWTLSATAPPTAWGEATFIGLQASGRDRSIDQADLAEAFDRFGDAASELRRRLAGQRIVLLGGEHLPHRIELTAAAVGARPAGLELLVAERDGGHR
jgi:hypothetical protein